jgi:hypothetical protein
MYEKGQRDIKERVTEMREIEKERDLGPVGAGMK